QIYKKGGGSSSIKSLMEESFLTGGSLSSAMIQTQVEILKSRTVSERAAKAINYQLRVEPEHKMIGILINRLKAKLTNIFSSKESLVKKKLIKPVSIKPLSVGSVVEGRRYVLKFDGPDSYKIVEDKNGALAEKGELNKPFFGPNFSILVEGDRARKGRKIRFSVLPLSSAASGLQSSLGASPIRNTELITVSATALRPSMAMAKVNAIVSEYKNLTVLKNTEDAARALRFIDEQIGTLEKSLRFSEGRLMSFKEKEKLVSLSDDASATLQQLMTFDMELRQSEGLRKQAEFVAENIMKASDISDNSIVALGASIRSPRLNTLAQRLSELQSRMITLKIDYKEKHPLVGETVQQIEETKKGIKVELSSIIASMKINERSIKDDISFYEKRIKDLPDAEKRLAELTRKAGVQQIAYSSLLQKKQEFEIIKASEIGNVWVVDTAASATMIKPKVKRSIFLALIVGLFMGVGIAFFLEYLDNTIKDPDDLKRITDLPLLGSIAKFDAQADGNGKELITHTLPKAGVSEAFRTIRTNIFFASFDTPRRIIGITSALPGEGKTLFMANLAVSIAQADRKVLLIDADMRRPRLHKIFSQKRTPGLSNIIMAEDIEGAIGEVTRKLPISGLDMICSGDIPHNPNELLGSQKMKSIIDMVSERYDYVLFDGPPILSVSDSAVLTNRLDGVIFTVNAEETEKNALKQALETIPGEKILGLVLNNVNIERGEYYYRYYQYYYSYGDQDQDAGKKRKKTQKAKTRIKKALGYLHDKKPWKQT
ncbi:MAG: polysaccharide biosynthesis tyrosine autokinase, partial [Deltaproteobacteria bacterium]|nr:polysaccharide biosynthesis tyrosine autokinase [Deltaproteobacteria bacterium]